ncbi:regulator of chromosome condensation-like [Polyodon spathula]|uniref:regulator of chromosome condensation-like n=1 Tax=Polyodon spathula TaxID=7913 RepID=UPI001B7DD26F|nr:regulator of chromosome condensation-like [Polyodon spathula]
MLFFKCVALFLVLAVSHPSHGTVPGLVLVLGQGDVGQLGLGEDVMERKRAVLLALPEETTQVEAGGMHTVCLSQSGSVYTFGCNDDGALGRDTSEEGLEMVPGKVELENRIVQVSAGDSHTAALSENGVVYIWGSFRVRDGTYTAARYSVFLISYACYGVLIILFSVFRIITV